MIELKIGPANTTLKFCKFVDIVTLFSLEFELVTLLTPEFSHHSTASWCPSIYYSVVRQIPYICLSYRHFFWQKATISSLSIGPNIWRWLSLSHVMQKMDDHLIVKFIKTFIRGLVKSVNPEQLTDHNWLSVMTWVLPGNTRYSTFLK